jgi:RNA polymerase sigma factor (TIGR02999 family)
VRTDAGQVTLLLAQLRAGDKQAAGKLIVALYRELRMVAARAMRTERPGHTLQPTALVNEAFLRLAGQSELEWTSRAHFLGVAARLMREILVDYARKRGTVKRGSGRQINLNDGLLLSEDRLEEIMAWNEILLQLEELDARQARIVELRFFAGMNVEEIAEVLEISTPTVKREWASAKAWLHHRLARAGSA